MKNVEEPCAPYDTLRIFVEEPSTSLYISRICVEKPSATLQNPSDSVCVEKPSAPLHIPRRCVKGLVLTHMSLGYV